MSGSDSRTGNRPLDFSTFVLSLGTSALVQMGEAPAPDGGRIEKDLQGARQTIDILAVLEEKTAGNLSEQEASLLRNLLTDLRLRYMRAGK
jgi:hypothetical protein